MISWTALEEYICKEIEKGTRPLALIVKLARYARYVQLYVQQVKFRTAQQEVVYMQAVMNQQHGGAPRQSSKMARMGNAAHFIVDQAAPSIRILEDLLEALLPNKHADMLQI